MTVTLTYALPTRGGVPPSTASTMSLYDVGYSGVMATVNSPEGVMLKKPPMFPSPQAKASELLNHLGSAAIKFCRICMTSRTESPDIVCAKRTKAIALQQITEIRAQLTESRDFKGWAQMCLYVLGPYLNEGDCEVLLAFTKVFQIAYCDIFQPSSADSCRNVCHAFVDSAKCHMPTLLEKQKTYLLHFVDCMIQFGPSSAFSAERHIFGNRLAPSRDIAQRFSTLQHLRYIRSDGVGANERERFTNKERLGRLTAKRVTESGAVMSQERKLVNSGDFIEVVTSQFEAKARERYKADPEKKKASVRDTYKADPEKKKASVRDTYNANAVSKRAAKRQRYQEGVEENRAAKRQRYQEGVEENRAAKRRIYRGNSATIKAARRSRYWKGRRTTTTTQSSQHFSTAVKIYILIR
eukprot:Em0006g1112a